MNISIIVFRTKYFDRDVQTCALHGKKKRGSRDHLVLIGDSRIRYIWDAFRAAFNKSEKSVKFYSDKTYSTDYVLIVSANASK